MKSRKEIGPSRAMRSRSRSGSDGTWRAIIVSRDAAAGVCARLLAGRARSSRRRPAPRRDRRAAADPRGLLRRDVRCTPTRCSTGWKAGAIPARALSPPACRWSGPLPGDGLDARRGRPPLSIAVFRAGRRRRRRRVRRGRRSRDRLAGDPRRIRLARPHGGDDLRLPAPRRAPRDRPRPAPVRAAARPASCARRAASSALVLAPAAAGGWRWSRARSSRLARGVGGRARSSRRSRRGPGSTRVAPRLPPERRAQRPDPGRAHAAGRRRARLRRRRPPGPLRRRAATATVSTATAATAPSRTSPRGRASAGRRARPSARSRSTTTTTAAPDLYVTYLEKPNLLYRNRGDGTFEEVGAKAGVALDDYCTSAAALDYDRDGNARPLRARLRPSGPRAQHRRPTTRRPTTSSTTTATARSPTSRRRRAPATPAGASRSSARTSTATAGPTSTSPTTSATTPTSTTSGDGTFTQPREAGRRPRSRLRHGRRDRRLRRRRPARLLRLELFVPAELVPERPALPDAALPVLARAAARLAAADGALARLLALSQPRRRPLRADVGRGRTSGTRPGRGAASSWTPTWTAGPTSSSSTGWSPARTTTEREIDFWNLMSVEYKKFEKGIATADFGDDSLWGRAAEALLPEPRRPALRRARRRDGPRVRREPARPRRRGRRTATARRTSSRRDSSSRRRSGSTAIPSHAKTLVVALEGDPTAPGPHRSTRDALGAIVTVEAGGISRTQVVSAGYSFLSSGPKELYFGLGDREKADRVTVRWPSGRITERRDVPAGRLALREPTS